jgi:hypothetical protein
MEIDNTYKLIKGLQSAFKHQKLELGGGRTHYFGCLHFCLFIDKAR